jgi:hypothetical protein
MLTTHIIARRSALLVYAALLTAAGCYSGRDGNGQNGGPDGDGTAGDGDGDGDGDGTADDGDGTADDGDDDGVAGEEDPAPSTRFFRLTHEQWENTVRDLFYLSEHTGFSDNFSPDPKPSGYLFDNNATALQVDQALWSGYQRAAADAAELATADPAIMAAILPPDAGDETARAEQFIREFGRRAYRRPLAEAEVTELMGQWVAAAELYSDEAPFEAGLRFVIEAMLQSPYFLYRVETSTDEVGGVVPLSGFEVAQRLSYFLWNTMPDDTLFDAADAGDLSTAGGVESEALRMLADARASNVMRTFHDQIFDVEHWEGIAPSPTFFPDAPDLLGVAAQTEHRMFVEEMLLNRPGSLHELLTSNETFVNDELAAIYGLEGTYGPDFVLAQLDPAERRGLFTQIGFLAKNATSVNPDPIHRGVFVAKRMACMLIAAPPDNVPLLPDFEGMTNRQAVEEHTEQEGSTCSACHSTIINPFGFPFENYDAMGAFRTMDGEFTVDPATTVVLDGEPVPVANALALADALAASPSVHECYLQHWIEYANGRPAVEEDDPLIERLGEMSLGEQASVQGLLVELVTSKPFLSRAVEELQ